MRFIADFHIHSHYSRATSPEMNIVSLSRWSQIKGTQVLGTGDFTHPLWFEELYEKLEPAEAGLFRLKPRFEKEIQKLVPESCRREMRFMLTVEISTIYKKKDKVRKVHSLVFAPSFKAVSYINTRLSVIGNIKADGRPILGLDTKELLKIVLDAGDGSMLVPAHAWTPHFAVFGSASGFDSLEECFDELTPYIYAVETGLSSDPVMNWRIPELDSRALISNSDAHSPRKLGREANVFNTELSYSAIAGALKNNDMKAFERTIEFYPEEGKYHYDGHRACGVRTTPDETKKNKFLCLACKKPLTVGVMHRVEKLAKRKEGYTPKRARPFSSIIPLPEIIAEVCGVGSQSKRVEEEYMRMISALGNEFTILLETPLQEIEARAGTLVREAVGRVRKGQVYILPGYDGEYGTIRIFDDTERGRFTPQDSLFN